MDNSILGETMPDARNANDFLIKYHEITNRLKKRFLRNPNVAEASEQFNALVVQCEQEEAWQYAGMCCMAVARCYHTLCAKESEIYYLLRAGRFFLTAHKRNKRTGCPSTGQENLQAAMSCFNDAANRCHSKPEFNVLAAGSMLELAFANGFASATGQLLEKSFSILPTSQAMDRLVSYHINQGDYSTALNLTFEFIDLIEVNSNSTARVRNLQHKAELNRLLLLLIQQPSVQRLPPAHFEIIEKYTSVEDTFNNSGIINEDEFLLLQSLVLACQSKDTEAIIELEGELWRFLDTEQKDLLRILIRICVNE